MFFAQRTAECGTWRDGGAVTEEQWLAQVSSSDYRTAVQITQTSEALRNLPALEQALGDGLLTLDQVAAATRNATPETDTGPSLMTSPSLGISRREVVLTTGLWSQPCCSQ